MSTHCESVYATGTGDVIICPESRNVWATWTGRPMRVLRRDHSSFPTFLLIPDEFADEYIDDPHGFEYFHIHEGTPRWVRTGEYVIHVDKEGVS